MIDTSPAHSPLCDARNGLPIILKSLLREGLLLLWRGFEYSRDLRVEAWNFAVERDILYQVGLSTIDLQWLIARRYVEFGQRRAGSGEHAQWLPQPPEPYQQKGICFFLTQAGADFALQTLREVLRPLPGTPVEPPGGWLTSGRTEMEANGKKPSWNREHRELRWGDCLIKQFKWPASNQKAILMAFEEECWPRRIDDPLPPHPEQDPKRRLHDTIKCLNRNHKARVIRFSGDGTGEGVYWAYLDGSAAAFSTPYCFSPGLPYRALALRDKVSDGFTSARPLGQEGSSMPGWKPGGMGWQRDLPDARDYRLDHPTIQECLRPWGASWGRDACRQASICGSSSRPLTTKGR